MLDQPARILIVDDDVSILMTLSELLRDKYNVSVAKSAQAAQKQLTNNAKPDLILMDVMMPGVSGIDMCKQLKIDQSTINIPVIFITALTTPEDEEAALAAGAVDFISKPISPANVRLRVALHIQLEQQRVALEQKNKVLQSEHSQISQILEKMHSRYQPDMSRLTYKSVSADRNSGDIILAVNTARGYYCLIGDFTGHGLPAAVGAPSLARVFMDSIQRACFSPAQLLQQINYELYQLLPTGMFVCAAFIYIDPLSNQAYVWNAGLPDQYLINETITPIASSLPPLGITMELADAVPSIQIHLDEDQHLFLYTDGISEYQHASGEMFGESALLQWLHHQQGQNQTGDLEDLLARARIFAENAPVDDDITIAQLSLTHPTRPKPGKHTHRSPKLF